MPTGVSGRFYSLSCETYSGTCPNIDGNQTEVFLFAVVRDVQRNLADAQATASTPADMVVSIRCRARRTAEPGRKRCGDR